jgi:sialate O-acetylesterase
VNITSGLMDGQVLQRNAANQGGATLEGTAESSGAVMCRIPAGPAGWKNWRTVGRADRGRWKARLKGLPVGGPYRLEFRIGTEQVTVRDVFVGDVWFLAGQSNMQGIGNLEDAPAPHPKVRCFYMRDEWAVAREPIHFLAEAVDVVHLNRSFGGKRPSPREIAAIRRTSLKGVGPAVYFAKAMLARTGVPQGLVACAHGGTAMAEWAPALKRKGGASFYGAMLRRFRKLGQPAAGLLWYQGCSDTSPACAALYTKRMKELVRAVRRDFGQPRLPWAIVQIGRVLGRTLEQARSWNDIQEQQRLLPDTIPNVDVVPAADLDLDDSIHISGADNARLGARLARVMARLALGDRREKPALRLKRVRLGSNLKTPSGRPYNGLEVAFDHVVGGLRAQGRPQGFAFTDMNHNPISDPIFKITLNGNRAFLECGMSASQLENLALHYGLGANPYVNLTDSRDMAVPVFGPVPLGRNNRMPYWLNWEVAALGEVPGGLAALKLPAAGARLRWHTTPKLPVPVLPCMIMPAPVAEKRHGLYLFRTSLRAERNLRLKLAIGSDSGIRLWLNGREVYRNLKATNPMIPDQYVQPVRFRKGLNQVLVGFDARGGQGWGFALRGMSLNPRGRIPEDAIQPA